VKQPESDPPAGILVRPAQVADADAIGAFQTRAWRETYTGLVGDDYLDRVTPAHRSMRWHLRIAGGKRKVLLAVDGAGEIVGVVSWSRSAQPDGAPELELNSLYVDARYHGTGVAQALTDRAVGDRPAHLWVFERNPRARAFYAKMGFRPDGAAKVDPDTRVPEIRMTRLPAR
jgi:GNAT superfamily N-acetyltransferase